MSVTPSGNSAGTVILSSTGATGGIVLSATPSPTANIPDLDEAVVVVSPADRGVQGPPGRPVELRRQGTSGIIEWRQRGSATWKKLIDLGDGVVAVKAIPPTFVIGDVSVVTDPALAGVDIEQPDPLDTTYILSFRLLQGAPGRDGKDGKDGKDGQPRFSGHGLPDAGNFPTAVDGDIYLDLDSGYLYTFHPENTATAGTATGGETSVGAASQPMP